MYAYVSACLGHVKYLIVTPEKKLADVNWLQQQTSKPPINMSSVSSLPNLLSTKQCDEPWKIANIKQTETKALCIDCLITAILTATFHINKLD